MINLWLENDEREGLQPLQVEQGKQLCTDWLPSWGFRIRRLPGGIYVYLPFVSKCAILWSILSIKFLKIILPIILSIISFCVNYLYALSICGFRVC